MIEVLLEYLYPFARGDASISVDDYARVLGAGKAIVNKLKLERMQIANVPNTKHGLNWQIKR